MSTEVQTIKSGLPLWAKFLVLCLVTGFFVVLVSLTTVVNFSANIAKKARNPQYISEVMKSVAVLPTPLPDGYAYQTAAAVGEYRFVSLLHKPDESGLAFITMPVDARLDDSAQIVQELSGHGLPGLSESFQVEKKGQEKVAGHTVDYVVGKSVDRDGTSIGTMIACSVDKSKNKQLLIYGWSLRGDFNFDVAQKLFRNIESL